MAHKTEIFRFTGSNGQRLDGRLEQPLTGPIRATALFAHCFTCTKSSHGATRISAALAKAGIATLRFDFTGLGGSEGEFADSGFAANVEDLIAAANALRENAPDINGIGAPQLLIGHSLGGAAVIAAASAMTEVRAVATIGAPHMVDHVLQQLGTQLAEVESKGEALVKLGGRDFRVTDNFVQQMRGQPQSERLAQLKRPLLVLHAPDDNIVPFSEAEAIYADAMQPKSLITLGNADHLLTRNGAAQNVAAQIVHWADGYLAQSQQAPNDLDAGLVRVNSLGKGFTQLVETPDHQWLADEPRSLGGDNLGATPYDLLLSSLGACTSMTLQMYAARKKWPLTHVAVTLEHSREHKADCEDCNNSQNRVDIIDRVVRIEGDLDDKQRARLLEIADKCPVHKSLTNRMEINTLKG